MGRRNILEHNRLAREGLAPVRKLDDGEVVFKIPTSDFKVLARIYPGLVSKDNDERLKAWQDLRKSPVGEKYLVTRTPAQVKRSSKVILS